MKSGLLIFCFRYFFERTVRFGVLIALLSRMFVTYLKGALVIGVMSLLWITSVHSSAPLWVFSTPNPTSVTVSSGSTATVQYTVTNQSSKSKNLILRATAGLSASPCHLVTKGSTCVLTITVNGSQIPQTGINAGPILCEASNLNQCYQPSINNQLRVNSASESLPLTSVGLVIGQPVLLSYTSRDFGVTWSLSTTLPPPQDSSANVLNRVSCISSGRCAAVGYYGSTTVPLSYTSTDYGLTWSVSTTLPPAQGGNNNQLNGVSCTSSGQCAAVGYYNSPTAPLSYTSTDYGVTWSVSTTLPTPQSAGNNQLISVSCISSGQCAAVGFYNSGGRNFPLSYTSADFGVTWTVSTGLPPVQGNQNNQLNGVSCNSSGLCTAVGLYVLSGRALPLSYTSVDYGATWSVSTTLPPPQGSTNDQLNSVSCSSSGRCAAVGIYASGSIRPLSYTSVDYGATWSVSTTLPPPQGSANDQLASVLCDSSGRCATVGGYSNGIRFLPLSYTSTDYGVTWSVSATLPPAQGSGNNILSGVS